MSLLTTDDRRAPAGSAFDVDRVRSDFPILSRTVNGKPLVYLDNAATSQKPRAVIDAVANFYSHENANVHRGVHYLSEHATAAYEAVRGKARAFLGAGETREVVFVRGTTDAINLVAHGYLRPRLQPGDEVLVSALEHHSNIVPWQLVCEERGARVRVIPMAESGELILDDLDGIISDATKLVAVGHVSNALGTVNPIRRITAAARAHGVPVLVDGAQGAPHMPIDVQDLDCDFYCLSGHKMFGPMGIGLLYGRAELLEAMSPYQSGGDMIRQVSFEGTTFAPIPNKFEAGTPNVAGVIGLGAAIDYLQGIGWDAMLDYERELLEYAATTLESVEGVRLIGTADHKVGVVSFLFEGVHAHDVGTIVDQQGVAIRTGHHCAQPIMSFYGVDSTARASFAMYNTRDEVDKLAVALGAVREVFG
ncbi:MAG: cysteine desulfurase [Gemmatimonadetes bacterium]|nr:cysteine desulfurase [Gemmatimonadota bacterium]